MMGKMTVENCVNNSGMLFCERMPLFLCRKATQ